ncbi:MAG: segregation and condensation protein A [Candidatus Nanopelagicaceae bacterium]|jgi:segregation and condensation protein A
MDGTLTQGTEGRVPGFSVHLDVFDGPFDLLLQLISKHKLDITEVALGVVTDEFIAHIRNLEQEGEGWQLDQATEFLVVAATLLDLKAARLLPSGEIDDEADLALLEARDLLFARLLQYRAFKQIADIFQARIEEGERSFPRAVSLEPHLADLLPEVVLGLSPDRFAALAERALAPREELTLSVQHLHLPLVSVAEQALEIAGILKAKRSITFRTLTEGENNRFVIIARFLGLLELFREGAVRFQQVISFGELTIEWIAPEDRILRISDEFDRAPDAEEVSDNE